MSLNSRRYMTQSIYLRLLTVIAEITVQAVQADMST